MRVVSLDYCSDQYVLELADREQIRALSPDAEKRFSYKRAVAAGLPKVRPSAEDVLLLEPDLVVRSYGGGPNATAFFQRAGIPVLQIGWASRLDGEGQGTVTGLVQQVADGLGQSARGEALVADFRARLDAVRPRDDAETALYMTQGGVTTGQGSLVHEILVAAGWQNFQKETGWHPIPLERLAYERPDIVAGAFFETDHQTANIWSAARHPIARAQFEQGEYVPLEGAWTACGGWFLIEAVEALADGGRRDAQ